MTSNNPVTNNPVAKVPEPASIDENRNSWYYQYYADTYDSWMPWMEEKYLAWFGENKTSYTARENMSSRGYVSTGIEPVNKLQDGVADIAGGQLANGGLLGGVGQTSSHEGVDRVERGDTVVDPNASQSYLQQGQGYLSSAGGYASSAGGYAGSAVSSLNPWGEKKE